ncbi:MAG: DUF5694 domain-containing protein [Bacteroidota bacterium]
MKNIIIIISLLVAVFHLKGQTNNFKDPDEFLVKEKRPQVLLVGTFHFAYPNQDAYKIPKDKQIDILSPQKQEEVEELIEYISRFKPTKVMLEAGTNTGYLMKDYARWQAGTRPLQRNEVYQLGFRLMKKFNLDTLYGVDAPSLVWEIGQSDNEAIKDYVNQQNNIYYKDNPDPMEEKYRQLSEYFTQLTLEESLLNNIKYLNQEDLIKRGFGRYLVGKFKNGDYEGPNALAMGWYDRNLRIYRNIQNIATNPEDRILVIFGAGHISILQQLYESTPEYELVKFNQLEEMK